MNEGYSKMTTSTSKSGESGQLLTLREHASALTALIIKTSSLLDAAMDLSRDTKLLKFHRFSLFENKLMKR